MALKFFYGTECPHCEEIVPLLLRLEQENNITVERVECWHNEVNARLLESADRERCGGVPFLWNSDSDSFLCGEVTFAELKDWATGK